MQVRDAVRKYLFETLLLCPVEPWPADDANLFEHGLDSLRVMRLLVFVEEQLGVHLPNHEITRQRLGTIQALVEWIEQHRRK
jgi:acyl carrier protein